ncbi:MAG: DUF4956 domain-containing protein [Erysipelotrichaceae bacterium]|nr:DUF4956 domain-containing protein [Erysipelotrichaceae bacterium]
MFNSVFNEIENGLSIQMGVMCTFVSLFLGIWIALIYQAKEETARQFKVALALLVPLVQLVIMMVNGNLGSGVAALGAFSLVRFRSVPGSSREIVFIFFAMAIGLAAGMGYLTFACFIAFVIGIAAYLFYQLPQRSTISARKDLHITIPENLDYTEIFDDIFAHYLKQVDLIKVKTIQLGSMFDLYYQITLKEVKQEKALIDALRCRNGNLNIVVARRQVNHDEL